MKKLAFLLAACLLPVLAAAQAYSYSKNNKEKDGFRWTVVADSEGHYGALDSRRRMVLPMQFKMVIYDNTGGGFLTTYFDGSKGFYTQTGKCVIPHARGYQSINPWDLGKKEVGYCFLVMRNGYVGVCDGRGNEVIAPDRYDEVQLQDYLDPPCFSVRKGGRYGVCDLSGREVVPPEYPARLSLFGGEYCYTSNGEKHHTGIRATEPDESNPFGKNKVKSKKFYADFGGQPAPNSQIPLPEVHIPAPQVAATPAAGEPVAGSEAETAGGGENGTLADYFTEEELAAINDALKTRKPATGETITVQLPPSRGEDDEAAAPADGGTPVVADGMDDDVYRQVREETIGEIRGYIEQKDFVKAYSSAMVLLEDERFFPTDPEDQCAFCTLLGDVKTLLTNEALMASASLNVGRYTALTTLSLNVQSWQQKLLIAAIGQGSQKATLMLQILNAATGMGGGSAPGGSVDFNRDYEPSLIQVEETCTLCHGTGVIKTQSVTSYGTRSQYVDEKCPSCGGKGTVTHLRNNPRK